MLLVFYVKCPRFYFRGQIVGKTPKNWYSFHFYQIRNADISTFTYRQLPHRSSKRP